jgi:hypothetical protein
MYVVLAYKTKAAQQAPLDKSVGSTSDNAPVETTLSNIKLPQANVVVKNIATANYTGNTTNT